MKRYIAAAFLMGLAACAPSDRLIAPEGDRVANATVALKNGKIAERLQSADYILLGEKHDNADHHKIQLAVLQNLLASGDVVVFEMLHLKQQPAIDDFLKGDLPYSDLEAALEWKKSGWPDWNYYGPLMATVREKGARIMAGSLPGKYRTLQEPVTTHSFKPLGEDKTADLKEEIRVSHCDLLPKEMLVPVTKAQIAKDQFMASKLAEERQSGRAFLIAGNGHVRKDRGIPYFLTQLDANASIHVLGLIEETNARDLSDPFPLYDTLWITEPAPEKDHCAVLRKKFGKS